LAEALALPLCFNGMNAVANEKTGGDFFCFATALTI
jgi:hypothetical protein